MNIDLETCKIFANNWLAESKCFQVQNFLTLTRERKIVGGKKIGISIIFIQKKSLDLAHSNVFFDICYTLQIIKTEKKALAM